MERDRAAGEGGVRTGIVLALAIIFAYLFLVALYESWNVPIPVLLSVTIAIRLGYGSVADRAGLRRLRSDRALRADRPRANNAILIAAFALESAHLV